MASKKLHEPDKNVEKQPRAERSKAVAAPPVSLARAIDAARPYVSDVREILAPRSELFRAPRGPEVASLDARVPLLEHASEHLDSIVALLLDRVKYDFRCYRRGLIARRIAQRVEDCGLDEVSDYLEFMRAHPDEVRHLSRSLLSGATGFFHDREAFEVLEMRVVADLVAAKHAERPVRVWVPGCATGEEAYSIAILLMERLEAAQKACRLWVFASDIDEGALQIARHGVYPEAAMAALSPERLARFFVRVAEKTYRVDKRLREPLVFAKQDLISDAPFSKLDLISCRNLLACFEPEVEKKILELLHFSLNEGGYLILGPSESIGEERDRFEPVSKKWRIYRRIGAVRRCVVDFPIVSGRTEAARRERGVEAEAARSLVIPLRGAGRGPRAGSAGSSGRSAQDGAAVLHEDLNAVREELAVSREELQSLNEELRTVSGEMDERIQERTAQLRAELDARKALEREVLGIAAAEQQRIGQELHDGLGQELTGLALMARGLVEALSDQSLPEARSANRIAEGLGRAVGQLRWLSRGLIPAEVDGPQLAAALSELAAHTGQIDGVSCKFQCDDPIDTLDKPTATHLARIAQEAITNALKHGRARHIAVSLAVRGGALVLTILNDGVSIRDQGEGTQGVGLRIMRHRADQIGAKLSVGPVHGGGTLVTCTLTEEGRDA